MKKEHIVLRKEYNLGKKYYKNVRLHDKQNH